MRSAVEAAGDQSIPPSPSSLRWSSPLPSTLPPPPPPPHVTLTKSPSPMDTQEPQESHKSRTEHETTGLEPGPSSGSPAGTVPKSPPMEARDNADDKDRGRVADSCNEGDDTQPSTSRAHSDFIENTVPVTLLKPKLEPLDDESSRDGFTPHESLAHVKSEAGLGRLSEMRSEDSRSEVSNVETKRYRVSFKVCSKAAARLKRILNAQPMALKRLGIAGVQVDPSVGMVSVAARAKERASQEASRRPEPSHSVSMPSVLPSASHPHIRGVSDRNGSDGSGVMVPGGMGPPQPGYPLPPGSHGHPGMHPGHTGAPSGHGNAQQPQVGDVPSGSGAAQMGAMPPSALPPHMQQQRQSHPPPTNSPILVNLLNSQGPPPSVAGRPFSPYPPNYPGGPSTAAGSTVGPSSSTSSLSGPSMELAYHHQQLERQRMMMQQQQMQQQGGAGTPTTPGPVPGTSGYGFPQRQMYGGQQGYPQGHPNAPQRVPYPGQPAMYGTMPQIKQEPGYTSMPQIKQELVESVAPPPKKRKKPTKKQQKEAEAAAAHAHAAQPGPYFPDGRMMHPQQMGGFPTGGTPHPQYPQGSAAPPSGMQPHYYQQQQNQQLAWQQQMHHQRMMQQQAHQQQMGMGADYPPGSHAVPPSTPSSVPWQSHHRPPPVPYPPVQNEGSSGGVGGVAGTGDMGSHSDSNSPATPFGGHPIMIQQQQEQPGHPSPMYGSESGGGTPTLFPYPSTSHPSGQSGLNSTPLTPGTTSQTPTGKGVGGHQGQGSLSNDHDDFDDKLLGEGTLDVGDLGDLDDIVPMGGVMIGGEGRVKDEMDEDAVVDDGGEGGEGNIHVKRNGRHDLDMSINSVVDMVAKGGGELSSTPPSLILTPTGGGGNGPSVSFSATTPTSNSSSTAPPTPTLQTPPAPMIRRKNTASSVQQLTTQQRLLQQQGMGGMGGQYAGGQHTPFGVEGGGGGSVSGMHLPNQPPQHIPHSGHWMEEDGRFHHPSYHQPSRGGPRGGVHLENGRVNGHPEMSNGSSSREESGNNTDATIQAILSKVKAQGMAQEQRAKEQRTTTGGKSRGGGTGTRKKRKANEITKERSPKEEDDAFIIGMDGMRGPPTMTAGQAAKARLGVGGGQGGGMARLGVGGGQGGGMPSPTPYYHQITQNLPMRSQPPPVQNKPS